MKRILAFTLATATAVSFASCGKKDDLNGNASWSDLTGGNQQQEISGEVPESPAEYLEYVVLENNKLGENVKAYFDIVGKSTENTASDSEITLSLGDGAYDFIGAISPENADEIYSYISWLKTLKLSFDFTSKDDLMKLSAKLGLNDKHIVSLDFTASEEKGEAYLSVPELTSETVMAEIPEYVMTSLNGGSMALLPDGETAEKLVNKYGKIAIDEISDKAVLSEEKLTVDGVTADVKVITLELNEEDALNVGEAVLESAVNDEDIKNIIKNYAETYYYLGFDSPEEMVENAIQEMNDALEEIRETTADSDETAEIVIYADKNTDELCGVEIYDIENSNTFTFLYAENNSKFALELSVNGDTYLEGSGNIAGNNATGTLSIYDEYGYGVATVEIKNYDITAAKNGLLKATAGVELHEDFIKESYLPEFLYNTAFEINYNQTSNTNYSADITVIYKDKTAASLEIRSEAKNAEAITLPASAVSVEDSEAMSAIVSGINSNAIISSLTEAGAAPLLFLLMQFAA